MDTPLGILATVVWNGTVSQHTASSTAAVHEADSLYAFKRKHICFYRAMHFSAKHGIAIACRLSVCPFVCPSVTLMNCDHIGWNSSKIISPLVIVWDVHSLQPQQDRSAPRATPLNLCPKSPTPVDLSVGDIRSQIAAEWLGYR